MLSCLEAWSKDSHRQTSRYRGKEEDVEEEGIETLNQRWVKDILVCQGSLSLVLFVAWPTLLWADIQQIYMSVGPSKAFLMIEQHPNYRSQDLIIIWDTMGWERSEWTLPSRRIVISHVIKNQQGWSHKLRRGRPHWPPTAGLPHKFEFGWSWSSTALLMLRTRGEIVNNWLVAWASPPPFCFILAKTGWLRTESSILPLVELTFNSELLCGIEHSS